MSKEKDNRCSTQLVPRDVNIVLNFNSYSITITCVYLIYLIRYRYIDIAPTVLVLKICTYGHVSVSIILYYVFVLNQERISLPVDIILTDTDKKNI